MNINLVVCVRSNWFAEIKTGMIIGERRPMRLQLRISSTHYQRNRRFLKAEEFQKELRYFDRKIQQRISFTCSVSILHVM